MNFKQKPNINLCIEENSLILLALGFTVFALWLPFGFSLTALIEEWGVLGTFVEQGLFFIVTPTSSLGAHALRPLTIFPHALAYFLDTNSFLYWHVLLILALLVKGFSVSYIIQKLTNSFSWAFLAGILILLYPADTMQINFRGLHINWSLSLVLFASCIFLVSTYTQNRVIYILSSIVAAFFMFSAICFYDLAIFLFCLPFLILYAQSGFQQTLKGLYSKKLLVLCWFGSISLYFLYAYYASHKISTYQASMVGGQSVIKLFALYYPKLFTIGALRGLLGGWFDAFRILFSEYAFWGYLYLTLITMGLSGLFLLSKPNMLNTNDTKRPNFRLPLIGILLLLAGYLPFALITSHSLISQRTFLFASPGAVIVWVSFLMLIANRAKKMAYICAFILIFSGLAAQLFQFHHYVNIATTQRTLLRNIVSNYNGDSEKTLIIVDKSNQLNHTWMFINENLRKALAYVYNHSIKPIQICHAPGDGWQLPDTLARGGKCIEHENSWSFSYPKVVHWNGQSSPHPAPLVLKKEDVFAITINPDGSINQDPKLDAYRQNLRQSYNSLSNRFYSILLDKNWPSHFSNFWVKQSADSYQWKFGKWWSLEIPTQGNGWREAEWDVKSFFHESSAWKAQKKATLQFNLVPKGDIYKLKGRFKSILSIPIKESITIAVNDHKIIFHWLNDEEFEASLPVADLLNGVNTLSFNSKTDPEIYGLSFRLASINLFPADLRAKSAVF